MLSPIFTFQSSQWMRAHAHRLAHNRCVLSVGVYEIPEWRLCPSDTKQNVKVTKAGGTRSDNNLTQLRRSPPFREPLSFANTKTIKVYSHRCVHVGWGLPGMSAIPLGVPIMTNPPVREKLTARHYKAGQNTTYTTMYAAHGSPPPPSRDTQVCNDSLQIIPQVVSPRTWLSNCAHGQPREPSRDRENTRWKRTVTFQFYAKRKWSSRLVHISKILRLSASVHKTNAWRL